MNPTEFSRTPTITAHAGCENTPDNSIESVEKAFAVGADIFEIDVHFDKNRIPVLSHNTPVGMEPTLDEVLSRMAEQKGIMCNLDIKATDDLGAVLACAKKHNVLDRVFYTGITAAFVESAKETPEIPYYLNAGVEAPDAQSPEYLSSLIETVKNSGAIGLNCHFGNVTPELIAAFHKNGLWVSVWTVNEKDDMVRMMEMNPDNITTRKPVLLKMLASANETAEQN